MSDAVQQISDLMFRYAELFDTGQFDEFAALFEHGQWHKAEPGAAAARQWITDNVRLHDGLTRTKHVTTNVVVDVDEDAGTATASAYVTIFQALPGFPLQPIFAGRCPRTGLTRIGTGDGGTGRERSGPGRPVRRHLPARAATRPARSMRDAGAGRHRAPCRTPAGGGAALAAGRRKSAGHRAQPQGWRADRAAARGGAAGGGSAPNAASMRAALARTEWDAVFDVSGVAQGRRRHRPRRPRRPARRPGRPLRLRFVAEPVPNDRRLPVARGQRRSWNPTSPPTAVSRSRPNGPCSPGTPPDGFPATIARPAAIYGPYNNIYDMEAAMFRRLLERRPVLLPYHGLVVGSYGHVDDLCRALLVMAAHPSAVGEVFNVTTSAVTSAAYVATLAEVVGVEPDVVLVPDDLAQTADRPLFSRLFTPAHHGMLDPSKITRVLGLSPVYDLPGRPCPDARMVLPVRRGRDEPGPIGPAVGPHVRLRLRGRGRRAGQRPLTRHPPRRLQMDADVQRLIDRQEIADLCVR